MQQIYLDHNATTPVDPDVIDAMAETARTLWANPSSGHRLGRSASEELSNRRAAIARSIGAAPSEIVFTAGGTEADNLALLGAARARRDRGRHILVSAVEHHAVLACCELLSKEGFQVETVPVDAAGRVDEENLESFLRDDTILVSVMHANNEVGTIQPIAEIGKKLRKRGVLFHTDAAQSVGKIPVDVEQLQVDLLTSSSHKIYGPKGTGFLYIRTGIELTPLLIGGGQEGGRRSGTENLPAIAGLAKALEIAAIEREKEALRLSRFRESLFDELSRRIDGVERNGHPTECLPGTLSLSIGGTSSADLLERLNREGIYVSASAACTTASLHPSHVLTAMGVAPERAAATLRISFGRSNREEDVLILSEILESAVHDLRKVTS